jgi:hypothetical protein
MFFLSICDCLLIRLISYKMEKHSEDELDIMAMRDWEQRSFAELTILLFSR